MYKVTKGMEKDAKDIVKKKKAERGQLLADVKVLEEDSNNKVSYVEGKEREMEWQKRNAPYYSNYLDGKNELQSTWYLEELKFNVR